MLENQKGEYYFKQMKCSQKMKKLFLDIFAMIVGAIAAILFIFLVAKIFEVLLSIL